MIFVVFSYLRHRLATMNSSDKNDPECIGFVNHFCFVPVMILQTQINLKISLFSSNIGNFNYMNTA